jgi:esterase/lipase superfamily enzyme
VLREYHKWHSPILNREMELLVFGHSGARVIVFPTSQGRFFDWENRRMFDHVQEHIDQGWLQFYCVDSVDSESWFNHHVNAHERTQRHLQYQEYIIQEVLPFSHKKNPNHFVIGTGCSFGAYHSASIALRYPRAFHRILCMSGVYDVREWSDGQMDDFIAKGSPCEYIARLNEESELEEIRKLDIIVTTGTTDPLFENSKWFSDLLWEKNIWHAFRVWDGFAHDWPEWYRMLPMYIGGHD